MVVLATSCTTRRAASSFTLSAATSCVPIHCFAQACLSYDPKTAVTDVMIIFGWWEHLQFLYHLNAIPMAAEKFAEEPQEAIHENTPINLAPEMNPTRIIGTRKGIRKDLNVVVIDWAVIVYHLSRLAANKIAFWPRPLPLSVKHCNQKNRSPD